MTAPTATPGGVSPTNEAFLCPYDCTMGWVTVQDGLTSTRTIRCECRHDECAPDGFISEVLCDCNSVLTPETVRGFDGVHPLCAECYAERIKPETHPVIQSVSDTIIPKVA